MANKIVPANVAFYDHFKAFKNNDVIDWTQNTHFSIGDIVYIYSSSPYRRISFKCEVINIDLPSSSLLHNDDDCWITNDAKIEHEKKNRFVRLKLILNVDDKELTYEFLKNNGMKGRPQSQRNLDDNVAFAIEKVIG